MTFTDLHLFSIHAPYAGATSDERTLSKYPIYFNPHPHKGATSGDYLVSSRTAAVNRREIFAFWERFANDLLRLPPFAPPTGDGITTNIFKKIALHFAPFMI